MNNALMRNEGPKVQFESLLRSTNRNGMESVLYMLNLGDFYTAPASTRFHGAESGGLLAHSLATCETLNALAVAFPDSFAIVPRESIIIASLLHDVCKMDFYKKGFRNRKNEATGQWEKVEVYEIEDQFPLGHGEKSVILLLQWGLSLTSSEMMAIRWHMGGFDDAGRAYGGAQSLTVAMQEPLVTFLHAADLIAGNVWRR